MTAEEALNIAHQRLNDGLVDTSSGDTWEEISYNEWDANYWLDDTDGQIKVTVYRVLADNEGGMTDPDDYYTKETV